MKYKAVSLLIIFTIAAGAELKAQSIFGLPEIFQQANQNRKISADYDMEFRYDFDWRNFNACDDILSSSMVINSVRLTPSVGFSLQQDKNTRHRVLFGISVMKELGANPASAVIFQDENDEKLKNLALFQKILVYYDFRRSNGKANFEALAGVFPNSYRSGYYSRAVFSDIDRIYNPEIEGAMLKYENARFRYELGLDCTSSKALERVLGYNLFTSGEYSPFRWGSIGWNGNFAIVRASPLTDANADNLLLNPYLKFDLGYKFGMEELSLRAGALASYQIDRFGDKRARFPMGAEIILSARNWGFGIEDSFFYGDNMMPFQSIKYSSEYPSSSFTSLIYKGESIYCTQRGYASINNRLELFYAPDFSDFVDLKASAIAYMINGNNAIKPFVGWQAKLSLFLNLDSFRSPGKSIYGKGWKKNARKKAGSSQSGSSIFNL